VAFNRLDYGSNGGCNWRLKTEDWRLKTKSPADWMLVAVLSHGV
jgi:hypothetical protein